MKTWRSFEAAARSCGSRAWPSTICVPQICGLMVQNRTSDKVSCLRLTWRSCPGKLGREWYFEGRARAMRSRASARGGRASPNFSAMDVSIRVSRGMRLTTVMPPNETKYSPQHDKYLVESVYSGKRVCCVGSTGAPYRGLRCLSPGTGTHSCPRKQLAMVYVLYPRKLVVDRAIYPTSVRARPRLEAGHCIFCRTLLVL